MKNVKFAVIFAIFGACAMSANAAEILTCQDSQGKTYVLSSDEGRNGHLTVLEGDRALMQKHGSLTAVNVLIHVEVQFKGDDGSFLQVGSNGVLEDGLTGFVKTDARSAEISVNCEAAK